MITLIILILMTLFILVIGGGILAIGGSIFTVIFADLIVAIFVLWWLFNRISKKKK